MIAFCSILVFFLYSDADVAAIELCNVTVKRIEKRHTKVNRTEPNRRRVWPVKIAH